MKEPNLERMSKEDIDEIKIDAYMSKEQTPIEWLVMKLQKEWTFEDRDNYLIFLALEKEKEHIQAKVLEALESFLDWCYSEERLYESKEDLIKDFLKQK